MLRPPISTGQDKLPLFPFFQIAHKAKPTATTGLLEHQRVVVRTDRFQAEHLDERAGIFVEMQPRLYDFRVVEYHQGALGQIVRQRSERVLAHRSVTVHQQFGLIRSVRGNFAIRSSGRL